MPPIRRAKYGHHTLAYWYPSPAPEIRVEFEWGSVQCNMLAEEECALAGHQTKNMVCCAKHHLEVPCSTCMAVEKQTKEAVESAEKKEETTQQS